MDTLLKARLVADFVQLNWLIPDRLTEQVRPVSENVAAILVDAVFQAGLNYRTVVFPRVCSMAQAFPRLNSLTEFQTRIGGKDFNSAISWNHPEKPRRLKELVAFFRRNGLETIDDIRNWLQWSANRRVLMSLKGIGPKTVDYLSRLVGLPSIAVDRHAERLFREVGIRTRCYEEARRILEFAADLLQMGRSIFDQLMWTSLSGMKPEKQT